MNDQFAPVNDVAKLRSLTINSPIIWQNLLAFRLRVMKTITCGRLVDSHCWAPVAGSGKLKGTELELETSDILEPLRLGGVNGKSPGIKILR